MKNLTSFLAAATIIGVGVVAPAALAQSCNSHDASIENLKSQYGEDVIARGLSASGRILVEFLRSEDGSWTIITTNTEGLTCILASGKAWTDLKVIPVKGPGA